ncbi:MAG: aspartate aminotransferase [Proteobacteria bacterium]|nr:aspartate aminotransferase [Pseudomonadota bacterium]
MAEISERSMRLGTENAFVVLAQVNELIREGRDVISFCIGQPDFETPPNIKEAGIKAINGGRHGYTPSSGILELRQAVADYIMRTRSVKISPEDVVIGAGAKPFIMYSILATTDFGVGDEVIYPNPGFPIYESQIRAMGAIPVPLNVRQENNFSLDAGELDSKINKNTKLIIINSPHNPTGGSIPLHDMKEVVDVLRKNPRCWIFADEIYSQLCYDQKFVSLSQFDDLRERLILCDGASKTWAMTGWRLGFAVNQTLAPVFSKWVTNTESCASQISQWAAVEAFSGPQDHAIAMKKSFLERRDIIVELISELPGVKCLNPGGAFYIWPDVTEACNITGSKDSEHFRIRLLEEVGVAVLADIHFGTRVSENEQHIRFSYAASVEDIKSGIARIDDFLRRHI